MTYNRMTIPPDDREFPSGPDGGMPRLYALLAVEVERGKIVYYHLELDHFPAACTIEMERDTENVVTAEYLEPLHVMATGPIHIRAQLSGTVVSDRPDYRPPTRAHTQGGAVLTEQGHGITPIALPPGGPHA